MIDRFLHTLIQKEFHIGNRKFSFLECLLAVCATIFGVGIRFSLNGINGIVLSGARITLYALLAILTASIACFLVTKETGSLKRGLFCYTALLFLPTMLMWGMTAGTRHFSAARDAGVLSLAYPNVFQLTGVDVLVQGYAKAAVWFTAALVCITAFFLLSLKIPKTVQEILKIVALFGLLLTYFLPYMQYGNGLFIDIIFVILAFLNPRRTYRALLQSAISFGAYTYGMTGVSQVPFYVFSLLELFLLADLGMEILGEGLSETGAPDKRSERLSAGSFIRIPLFLLLISVLAFLIRAAFFDVPSMDYLTCLKPWVEEFKAAGSFRAIVGDFYNYTPVYMYILYFISLLPCEPLLPIKLVSCLFDVILAVLGYRITAKLTGSSVRAALAYGLIICLPTVAVNSGMWGQCDVIYVTCIIASLYLLYENKSHGSMVLFGLAFAIKLQTLFVFPFYLLMWVYKKYRIEQFLYVPAMYILTCIPAALAGKSIKELLLIYVNQGNTEPWMLSWNWPNIYILFGPTNFYEVYKMAGILGTLAMLMLVVYHLAVGRKCPDEKQMLKEMLAFALLVPFTLPYMHERYGYLADILIVLYALINPRKLYLALLQILLSFLAYLGYLHGASIVPQIYSCFAMLYLILDLMRDVLSERLPERKKL